MATRAQEVTEQLANAMSAEEQQYMFVALFARLSIKDIAELLMTYMDSQDIKVIRDRIDA